MSAMNDRSNTVRSYDAIDQDIDDAERNESPNANPNIRRGESSNLLITPGKIQQPKRNPMMTDSGSRQIRSGSNTSATCSWFIVFISYILAVLLGSTGYYNMRQSLQATNRTVMSLTTQIVDNQNENNFVVTDLQNQLLEQHIIIKRLSNLSNAYVLEVMQNTKTDIYDQMSIAQLTMLNNVEIIKLNVTQKIADSQILVNDMLMKSAHTLQIAQSNMTTKLFETKKEYDIVANKAVTAVKLVQANVTQQLEHNTAQLESVVEITKVAVEAAQRNFTSNLARSRQELSDAMHDTDIAIASAENNVTAKLNKSAIEFKAAVTTATHQLDVIQHNVSLSLSLMSGTLRATSADLNAQVETAKITIHQEVEAVQASIEEYVAFTDRKFASENDFVRYQLAGTFTLLGCLISLWHLTSHLRHYYKPDVQRRVMAVLWMVPIYSITSWLSLVFPRYDSVFSAIRDCYEAYAVYTFIALLIAIMEDGQGLPELLSKLSLHVVEERRAMSEAITKKTKRPAMHLRPPFPCCYAHHRPTSVATAWLFQCQLMTMQFVMLKPLLTALPFILRLIKQLDYDNRPPILNGQINPYSPKLYIQLAENLSVGVAFYALLSFFHGTEKDLAWCDPWPKFLCIKGVVFMTFWQGFVIQIMGSLGMVNEKAALQIQNLLICIEMLIASLAHFYIFPYHEWQEGYKREKEKNILLRDTLALRDFVRDMRMMVTTWDPAPETSQTGQSAMEEMTENPNMNVDTDYEDNGNSEKERGDGDCHGNEGGDEYDGQGRDRGKGRESSDHIGISMIDILPINPSRTKNETMISLSMEPEHSNRNYSQGYPISTSTTTSFIPPSSDTKNRPLKKSTSTSTSTSQQEGKGAFEFFNPLHFPTIPSMSRLSGSNSYTSIPDDEGTWTESLELKGSENSRVLAAAIGSIDKNILELKGLGFDVGPDNNNENKEIERKNNVTLRNFNSQGNDKVIGRKLPNSRSNEEIKNNKIGGSRVNDGNGVLRGKETRGQGEGGVGGGIEKGDDMFLTSSGSSRSDIAYSFNSNSDDYMDSTTPQSQSKSQTWQSRLSLDKELNNTTKTKNENKDNDKVEVNDGIKDNSNNKSNDSNINNNNNNSPKGPQNQIPGNVNPNESVALRKRSWSSSNKKKSENSKRESYSSYEEGEESDDDDDDDEGDSESSSNSERDDDTTSINQNTTHKKTSLPLHTGDDTSTTTSRQTAYFPFSAFTPSQPPILNNISTETESSWRTADDEARTEGTHVHPASDLQPDSGSELEPDLESTTLEQPSVRVVTGDKALLSSQQTMNNTEINKKKSLDREGKGGGMGERKGEREEIEEEADVYKQIYNSYDDYSKTDTTRYGDVGVKGFEISGPKSSRIDPQRDSVVMTSSSSSSSSAGNDTAGPRTNLESDVRTAERTSLQQDSVSDQRNGDNSSTMELESGSRSMPVPVQGDGVVFGLDLLEEESV